MRAIESISARPARKDEQKAQAKRASRRNSPVLNRKPRLVELPGLPPAHPRKVWSTVIGNNGRNAITETQFLTAAAWAFDRLKTAQERNKAVFSLFLAVHTVEENGGQRGTL